MCLCKLQSWLRPAANFIKIYIGICILFSIIFILFVMHLVRKNKLEEKYSILWVIASVVILIVSLFPRLITIIANKFNVYYPPSLMLLFAIIILGAYIIHISVVITKQNKMIVKLTQELGILKEKIEEKNNSEEE